MEQQEATTIDLTADDDVPVAPPGGPAPPAGMPPMPPLRRSENSESDSSLPDFAAASSSDSESDGRPYVAPPLEAALRGLTPRMPPLRRSASSASDSSLPDLASASSSASEAESEGSFNLPRLARGQTGSAAFWAGVDNWRRESGITEPRSPEEEGEIMHAMSELAVNVLAASRREGDREVARTLADRLECQRRRAYYDAVRAARENGEPHPPPPQWLLREWRRRRDTFLLCRRRFYESKKRLESSSCWAFWPRLFERFDVVRAVAGPDAEDVYGHMVRYL
mmetsp:Transcript_21131/g.55145  ORF Transcript_21131/g.55145 Transcript_21131/m.55145 type:complete len:281 (-) Transcript_21131:25-867(-)